ncbi:NAD-P-binding protein [Polychaeton citri CBS 116435]|uniref:NAD-P-binding protein n=1 Tax=Polychaeton citri CBS 116435 TaxID=1314669 RepID=A0A9P4Q5R1_9PEZI|nr:NAD-P-binding protein [Polychaeton citri CBS 116435]
MASTGSTQLNLGLGLEHTHVLVTGGAGLIGSKVVHFFLEAGARVSCVDLSSSIPLDLKEYVESNDRNLLFLGNIDITKDINEAFTRAEKAFGPVQCCVGMASLDLSVLSHTESLADAKPEDWQRILNVNINGTFMTCQRWLQGLRNALTNGKSDLENVNLVIMGSVSGRLGERFNAAYAASKSAVQYGLMYSLAEDAPRIYPGARVNAVAPGAVDTPRYRDEQQRYGEDFHWKECEATVPLKRAVSMEDVARAIVVLASERWSGSINRQLVAIDNGKMGTLCWTKEEIANS